MSSLGARAFDFCLIGYLVIGFLLGNGVTYFAFGAAASPR